MLRACPHSRRSGLRQGHAALALVLAAAILVRGFAHFVDPKNFDEKSFVDFKGDVCIIPPNSFALARTVEYFRIPRSVLTICLGKSTYARCGIIVNVTPFEPEWEGYVTLEFSNTTPLPAKIYAGEGCAQVLFFGSTMVLLMLVKILNSSAQRMS
jgi:deoxycytidine triphosphate deaminase